jgi:hypothetical protein
MKNTSYPRRGRHGFGLPGAKCDREPLHETQPWLSLSLKPSPRSLSKLTDTALSYLQVNLPQCNDDKLFSQDPALTSHAISYPINNYLERISMPTLTTQGRKTNLPTQVPNQGGDYTPLGKTWAMLNFGAKEKL